MLFVRLFIPIPAPRQKKIAKINSEADRCLPAVINKVVYAAAEHGGCNRFCSAPFGFTSELVRLSPLCQTARWSQRPSSRPPHGKLPTHCKIKGLDFPSLIWGASCGCKLNSSHFLCMQFVDLAHI